MIFRQILHRDLGCASYVIADGGSAVVVDPKWEIDEYLEAASEAGARITHVLETHVHADHVSGRVALAAATGASVGAPLSDGAVVSVGDVSVRAVAAPGHRPEHTAYVVSNGAGAPVALLSGDSLLIGDVARPDLAVEARAGASALWETLRRLQSLGDGVELWPGHVGGSLCGSRALSSATCSTIGAERVSNPLLALSNRGAFIEALTEDPPPRPPTASRVVSLNRAGASAPGPLPVLDSVDGCCVLDVRPPAEFDAGHLSGSLNVALAGNGVGTRAGWAVGEDESIAIVAADVDQGSSAAQLLYAAGLWNVAGIVVGPPGPLVSARAYTPAEVVASFDRLLLVDVRDEWEWEAGHVEGSVHLPLSALGDGSHVSLPRDQPLAVACATGPRSALAASVLRRRGYGLAARVDGGISELDLPAASG